MLSKIIVLINLNFILLTITLAQETTAFIQLSSREKIYGKVELKESFLNIKSISIAVRTT
jgi:hypothetical protein